MNITKNQGTWTTVYDQGILVEFPQLVFFSFGYYLIEDHGNNSRSKLSKCYQTSVGWIIDESKNKRGCFKGYKSGVNTNTNTFVVNEQNTSEIPSNNEGISDSMPNSPNVRKIQVVNLSSKHIGNRGVTSPIPLKPVVTTGIKVIHRAPIYKPPNVIREKVILDRFGKFVPQKPATGYIKDSFPQSTIVSKFRFKTGIKSSKSQLSYSKIDYYKHMASDIELIDSLNFFRNKRNNIVNLKTDKINSFGETFSFKEDKNKNNDDFVKTIIETTNVNKININYSLKSTDTLEDISMFPKHFDWKHIVRPATTQGKCGSCFAIAALKMAEARIKLIYNHDVSLSVQHILNCSYYSQSCDGGFSILAMKFGSDFEMIPEHCMPYTGEKTSGVEKCNHNCNVNNLRYVYKFLNYYYVGGSYRKCNEKLMMNELYINGPFVVSFSPEEEFIYYKSGVYSSKDSILRSWVLNGQPKPEFIKVDHSVLLVGWGEEKNLLTGQIDKYWIVQNTWGTSWGEDGYFKIIRGIDEKGIESMCEAGTPVIVDSLTKLPLTPKQYKEQAVITVKSKNKSPGLDS